MNPEQVENRPELRINDAEVARRMANLEHEAFNTLEECVATIDLSIDQIAEKLSDKTVSYDEKRALEEMLFQISDLERLRGKSIDESAVAILKKTYGTFRYSKIFTEKLVQGIEPHDTSVIGEAFKDEKLSADFELLAKLTDDRERTEAFEICKKRIPAACRIVSRIEDADLALKMYAEILPSVRADSYADKSSMESTGKDLATRLYKAGSNEKLKGMIEVGTLQLSCCKDFINRFEDTPQFIIELVKKSGEIQAVQYALKFIADPELLEHLESDNKEIALYAKTLEEALRNEPEIKAFSALSPDNPKKFEDSSEDPRNKFVMGVSGGKFIIAWSNMDAHEYHKDIFQSVGSVDMKSGGYMGLKEEDGKIKIRMVRSSGDFGLYSRTVLERFRPQIERELKKDLGDKEFELDIKTSSKH